jgi:glutamate-5-semialdehyde dehydrogenase
MDIIKITDSLHEGTKKLANQNALQKNKALSSVISAIQQNREAILQANLLDVKVAQQKGTSDSLIERLSLDDKKIDDIINSIKIVISQTDPIGEEILGWKTPNGMTIRQLRVPIGTVAIIYESRPNVTVDAFCLAYKSGNSILLRGSSSAINSNRILVKIIKQGLSNQKAEGIPEAIELAPCESHDEVDQILSAVGKIDVVLPRGGAKLINSVIEKAKIPVIQTGAGVCHLFVDESADISMAVDIAYNSKTQRPGACNSIECILIHKNVLNEFLNALAIKFQKKVTFHADENCFNVLSKTNVPVVKAEQKDYGFEFLDFDCTLKEVSSISEAIQYINSHNTKHSESIITNNRSNAKSFQSEIDAACIYVNCSTRFTDGGEFGFGAELGISTQKLHARGPMGIKALTTTKYLIDGDGQIR